MSGELSVEESQLLVSGGNTPTPVGETQRHSVSLSVTQCPSRYGQNNGLHGREGEEKEGMGGWV